MPYIVNPCITSMIKLKNKLNYSRPHTDTESDTVIYARAPALKQAFESYTLNTGILVIVLYL